MRHYYAAMEVGRRDRKDGRQHIWFQKNLASSIQNGYTGTYEDSRDGESRSVDRVEILRKGKEGEIGIEQYRGMGR